MALNEDDEYVCSFGLFLANNCGGHYGGCVCCSGRDYSPGGFQNLNFCLEGSSGRCCFSNFILGGRLFITRDDINYFRKSKLKGDCYTYLGEKYEILKNIFEDFCPQISQDFIIYEYFTTTVTSCGGPIQVTQVRVRNEDSYPCSNYNLLTDSTNITSKLHITPVNPFLGGGRFTINKLLNGKYNDLACLFSPENSTRTYAEHKLFLLPATSFTLFCSNPAYKLHKPEKKSSCILPGLNTFNFLHLIPKPYYVRYISNRPHTSREYKYNYYSVYKSKPSISRELLGRIEELNSQIELLNLKIENIEREYDERIARFRAKVDDYLSGDELCVKDEFSEKLKKFVDRIILREKLRSFSY